MLEPKLLRHDPVAVAKRLAIRGYTLDVAKFQSLEETRKTLQVETEEYRAQRNQASKAIGIAKGKGEDASKLIDEVSKLVTLMKEKEVQLNSVQSELQDFLLHIPNIPDESVPPGEDDSDNVVMRTWGEIPEFSFSPKDHVDLGEGLGLLDFSASAKLAASRFVVMHGALSRLHRALGQFMLDTHVAEHGYEEVYVPYLVNKSCLVGTGQLPKLAEDIFTIDGEHALSLVPTAEVPVTNLARDHIFSADALPKCYVCHTPCFRSEAGSYGKDTRGMIRQHQFEKVELVHMVKPDDSFAALEELTGHAEKILQLLQLPYRVVTLCSGDLGFSSAKTYDLEVWLPGQARYREISSCSNMLDFQARRMQARWRNPNTGASEYIHTLNGSGLALGRTLIAILENYQDENGCIAIPEVLQPYMKNLKLIE